MGRTKKAYMLEDEIAAIRLDRQSIGSLEDAIDGKDVEILELKNQINGYKAVISYLEFQMGLKNSQ